MPISRARLRRVNEALREVLAAAVQRELSDPRLELVTITQVEASSDLRHAKVWFTVLQKRRREGALEALEAARGILQARVAQELSTRHTPQLTFLYDEHQEEARRLSRLIDEVVDEHRAQHPDAPATEGPG
ncbi:MAG: 30S ribosome-binding factor RbfA [Thermoleophilia bacterium]|jgi:ribosome-binding factor A|nr:30S ribosome-binding factor RbfA [Thermoleophilia bacterium]